LGASKGNKGGMRFGQFSGVLYDAKIFLVQLLGKDFFRLSLFVFFFKKKKKIE
jgi:cell shape-determining protein MreD